MSSEDLQTPEQVAPGDCPVCCGQSRVSRGTVPGFVEGMIYEVFECETCHSQSVPSDTVIPVGLYDAVYRHAGSLPGYYRYHRYADTTRNIKNPLYYLSRSEDVYWAVTSILSERRGHGQGTVVIDVGSGLGYLTAALRADGYEAWGTDVSSEAVQQATRRFGPWFFLAESSASWGDLEVEPDVIVALETIEHVSNPAKFLASLAAKVNPGGEVLLSTPNKDRWSPECVWETDLPPVHLHWLSEDGLRTLGRRIGCTVELVDFTEFNQLMGKPIVEVTLPTTTPQKAVLDSNLSPTGLAPPPQIDGFRDRLVRTPAFGRVVALARRPRQHTDSELTPSQLTARRRSNSAVARYTSARDDPAN